MYHFKLKKIYTLPRVIAYMQPDFILMYIALLYKVLLCYLILNNKTSIKSYTIQNLTFYYLDSSMILLIGLFLLKSYYAAYYSSNESLWDSTLVNKVIKFRLFSFSLNNLPCNYKLLYSA